MSKTPFSYSPLVQDDMLRLGQQTVYEEASEVFEQLTGVQIDPSQFQRIVNYYGEQLEEVIQVLAPNEASTATVCYTMVSIVLPHDGMGGER